MKIKDRFLLGVVTGLIASIPGRVLNEIEYRMGLTEHTYEKAAGSIFVQHNEINTPAGKAIGIIANQALVATAGVATTYVLSATGRDNAVTKGIGIKMLYWMLLEGLPSNLGIAISHKKPQTPLLSILDHIIFGASCGYLASKLGDDSLFPDATPQLPLVANQHNKKQQGQKRQRKLVPTRKNTIEQPESGWVH